MAAKQQDLEFRLYRLIISEIETLFPSGSAARNDADYLRIISQAANPACDVTSGTDANRYKWSLRLYQQFDEPAVSPVLVATARFARSLIEHQGKIVTDDNIVDGVSTPEPPTAIMMNLFFYMARHLVAVEYSGTVMTSETWRDRLHDMLDKSAKELGFSSRLRIEPYPKTEEILNAFRSFSRLTRLRVCLRLPNPELSRYSENLRQEMIGGGVREYLQDMRNPDGLSQEPGRLPHAAAAMAEQGYKEGEVRMEGIIQNKRQTVVTGQKAATGKVEGLREFVRGASMNAKTKETKQVLSSILSEIDDIAPRPDQKSNA